MTVMRGGGGRGGGWEIFTKFGGKPEMEGSWFYNGEIFLHSWQRDANPSIL